MSQIFVLAIIFHFVAKRGITFYNFVWILFLDFIKKINQDLYQNSETMVPQYQFS